MKYLPLALFLAAASTWVSGQESGGIQFSGTLSANLTDDLQSGNATFDNNAGDTYIQLNATLKEGAFGMDSQLQFGPSGSVNPVSNFFYHYGYGYANFLNNRLYLAVGRLIDLNSFGLNSAYLESTDGPGVYGNAPGKVGSTGFGYNGAELRIAPVAGLLIGVLIPYNPDPFPIVKSTFEAMRVNISYTVEKAVQVVVGYQAHTIDVADYSVPSTADPNTVVGKNKLFALANLLLSEDLVAGARVELDHSITPLQWYSVNAYLTAGGKIGGIWVGVDGAMYAPSDWTPGFEALATLSDTFHDVLTSVDLQPSVSAGFFNSNYPVVTLESGVTTTGRNGDNFFTVNPQLKLLLGRSQHVLALGYTLTVDLDNQSILLNQINVLAQFYF